MSADEVGEDLGNTIFWPASNDQLELLQMVYLNPASEHTRETFIIIPARWVAPEATALVYHRSSSWETSSSVNNEWLGDQWQMNYVLCCLGSMSVKRRVLVDKITRDDTPKDICSDCEKSIYNSRDCICPKTRRSVKRQQYKSKGRRRVPVIWEDKRDFCSTCRIRERTLGPNRRRRKWHVWPPCKRGLTSKWRPRGWGRSKGRKNKRGWGWPGRWLQSEQQRLNARPRRRGVCRWRRHWRWGSRGSERGAWLNRPHQKKSRKRARSEDDRSGQQWIRWRGARGRAEAPTAHLGQEMWEVHPYQQRMCASSGKVWSLSLFFVYSYWQLC